MVLQRRPGVTVEWNPNTAVPTGRERRATHRKAARKGVGEGRSVVGVWKGRAGRECCVGERRERGK
eukprot:15472629-Alexandrium_andersonii.AAC.1